MSKETADKIILQARAWQTNRRLYPGWIIAPRKVRERLWTFTDGWVNPISSLTDEVNSETKLWVLFELNWRLEKCLMPLFDNLAVTVETSVSDCDPLAADKVALPVSGILNSDASDVSNVGG